LITESTVKKDSEAHYFSRGQKYLCEQRMEEEDRTQQATSGEGQEWEGGEEEEKIRVYG
jgi:hypothetical protein